VVADILGRAGKSLGLILLQDLEEGGREGGQRDECHYSNTSDNSANAHFTRTIFLPSTPPSLPPSRPPYLAEVAGNDSLAIDASFHGGQVGHLGREGGSEGGREGVRWVGGGREGDREGGRE
jgi:hypothetical protein